MASLDCTTVLIEIHRMLVSSFLILPKTCEKQICTFTETIMIYPNTGYTFYIMGFNCITFLVFFSLYISESIREIILLDNLCNNKSRFADNESIKTQLNKLPTIIRRKILIADICYKRIVLASILFFLLNTMANCYILFISCNIPTLLILTTNSFFMGNKLSKSYAVTKTEKYIFYSAVYDEKYQFNDIKLYF
jgi:hypothetical protein